MVQRSSVKVHVAQYGAAQLRRVHRSSVMVQHSSVGCSSSLYCIWTYLFESSLCWLGGGGGHIFNSRRYNPLDLYLYSVCPVPGHVCPAVACAALDLSLLQQFVLPLDMYVPHWTVLPLKSTASGRVCPTAACTAAGHVCCTEDRAASGRICPPCAMPLDVSVIHQPVLPLDVSVIQKTVLPVDISVLQPPCAASGCVYSLLLNVFVLQQPVLHLDVCLFYSSLCCPCTCLLTEMLFLDKSSPEMSILQQPLNINSYKTDTSNGSRGCWMTDTSRGSTGCCRTGTSKGITGCLRA
jgi:hypothetical protein